MARFIVESPHTDADCAEKLDSLLAHSEALLGRFDWGCKAGLHVGWATMDAGDEATIRQMLPTSIRAEARIVELNKFSPDEVRSFHKH